ncbi:hypothetical protein K2173_016165 [Erythroxylum novogranatense]|uniref:Uncharacterized protein n=1 Tax=Erythroxylum novogranatense TaxID=1862640 RepID=A0AAV8SFQ9_9ROSI|nr:hypothetical protein K2173_016165 [Erythroxylum novogranatense]
MNVLDSPLDALVFDYASLGILTVVNNLWTWVALLTAAISFWRIRAAGASASIAAKSKQASPAACIDRVAEEPQPIPEISLTEPVVKQLKTTTVLSRPIFEDAGVCKGKFVAYFEDDTESEENVDDSSDSIEVDGWSCYDDSDDRNGEDWFGGWERLLLVKMGDTSWYRYQDLTAIDGNVVRLWDGVRAEKYGSSILVVN